jgi:hypothetical protein
MTNENSLMEKLMISKKIMDKHSETPRGAKGNIPMEIPTVKEYTAPNAVYNVPQEMIGQTSSPKIPKNANSEERIMASKLPEAIKRLMLEYPIAQPQQTGSVLSDDLVEKASRLMKMDGKPTIPNETPVKKQVNESYTPTKAGNSDLKTMLREAVREVLKENGLLAESTEKSDEMFSFRVGKHVFEGKVTRIKKIK